MREIKFRQWSSDRFHYWGCNADSFTGPLSNRLDIPSEQFTGLHDKNGKEIYEGDVLKDKYEYRGTAHWYGSGFEFINTSGMMENGNDWEVIGNIHENPELLGELNDNT